MNRITYRRVRETCADCDGVIDHEPQHGGCTYGWEPRCGVCFSCFSADLFGGASDPTDAWWRKVRKLLRAADAVLTENVKNMPDLDEPAF